MSVNPTDLELEHDGLDLALKVDRRHLPVPKVNFVPAQDHRYLQDEGTYQHELEQRS